MQRLPFVDTHVHFHDMQHPTLRYSWLEPTSPVDPVVGPDHSIRSMRYWADDFAAETRFQNVSAVIHVQAAIGSEDPVDETAWLQGFSDRTGLPTGAIVHVTLDSDLVAETLVRHLNFPITCGVRDLRDDDYLTSASWRAGFKEVANAGLVYCIEPFLEEAKLVRALAEDFPEVTLCIDHAAYPEHHGKPRVRDRGQFAAWKSALATIAGAGNTVIKISGLGMSDHEWTPQSLQPWIDSCIEEFGVERVVFGTNWPLDRLYSSYGDVLEMYGSAIGSYSLQEQELMFSRNAFRIFGLDGKARR